MIEILKRQLLMVNGMLKKEKMSSFRYAHVSAVDRKSNAVIFRAFGVEKLTMDTMVVVSLEDGRILEGEDRILPKDVHIHLDIYRNFPQINSIAHVYPKWTSIYSQSGKSIPVSTTRHAITLRQEIKCSRDLTQEEINRGFQKTIGTTVVEAMRENDILDQGAVLARYDGAIVWGATPLKALDQAKQLESIANAAWHMQALIGSDEEIGMPQDLADQYFDSLKNEDTTGETLGIPGEEVTAMQERQIGLEMLIYFDRVCREHGIKYSLTGGTLLGAIRHSGFIPWDDDVDVFLTRPEFDKLESVFDDNARFVYVTRKKEPDFNYVFGRLVDTKTLILEAPNTLSAGKGVFLDVCVVDGLPNSKFLRDLHIKYMRVLMRCRRATVQNPAGKSYRRKGVLYVLAKKVLRLFTDYQFWNRRLEKAMSRYSYEKSEYVGNFTSQYGKRELLHKEVFDSYIDVPFEGHTFMICAGYHEYLKNIYKKYMSFPEKSKRKGHHPNRAIWVE